jgi:hypothetical protein
MKIGDRVALVRSQGTLRGTVRGFMECESVALGLAGALEHRVDEARFASVDWDDLTLAMLVETRLLDVIQ